MTTLKNHWLDKRGLSECGHYMAPPSFRASREGDHVNCKPCLRALARGRMEAAARHAARMGALRRAGVSTDGLDRAGAAWVLRVLEMEGATEASKSADRWRERMKA